MVYKSNGYLCLFSFSCQEADEGDSHPLIQKILEILYATEVRNKNEIPSRITYRTSLGKKELLVSQSRNIKFITMAFGTNNRIQPKNYFAKFYRHRLKFKYSCNV